MFSASLYIIVCSFRNRARVRLQRLRQPRYFVGAIAGAAYLYFSFFARFRASRSSVARRSGGRPVCRRPWPRRWLSRPRWAASPS